MSNQVLGMIGAGIVMGASSLGAAVAMGIAGSASIGAWKRCYKANKPAPMTLLAFVGFPLTEVFYGYILMTTMMGRLNDVANPGNGGLILGAGIGAGISIAAAAIAEGWVGASAADILTDTGKGFANCIAIVGICETVALFVMVLTMISV